MRWTAFFGLALLAPACSSTGKVAPVDAGPVDSGNTKTCFESSAPNQGCINCVESLCAAQLDAVATGCSDLIDCECPGGYYSASTQEACEGKAEESSCTAPAQAFEACEMQSCTGECTVLGSGSSGSSGSSSGG